MKPYFITGTDTHCGKTFVTCRLLDYFTRYKKNALALKPVASGGLEYNGKILNEDIIQLNQYNKDKTKRINAWQFSSPISPHLAAREVGIELSIKEIDNFCRNPEFDSLDYLLIEGAGGLLVPLNEKETWLDFLKWSQTSVILVVGMRLGCLNHAFLTEFALKNQGITCAGWIANCVDNEMQALNQNIETLRTKMDIPWLATLPYGADSFSESYLTTLIVD